MSMRRILTTALLAGTMAAALAAQSRPSDGKRSDTGPRTLTLTGCVEKGVTPNQYTIEDDRNGKYEVSGSDIRKYLGQRVRVAGTPGSTRFRVKGGLWPTPNVAGQAGAIDPAKAAIAAMPGGGARGTGEVDLPTFKVKAVRTVEGGCG
jgi:hypothetical protein